MLNFYSRLAGAAGVLLLAPGAPALAQALTITITNLTPTANARAVPRNASVVATFSQPLTAASAGALKVFSSQRGGLRGGGTATVAGNVLTFAPAAYDFRPGEAVQYTVTTGAAGAGGPLATPRVGQFTTAVRVSTGQFGLGSDPSVGTQPFSSALGDIDADSDLDLVVANGMSGQLSIRSNNSQGTFSGSQTLTAGGGPGGNVALADVDGDGDLDLLKADQGMGINGGTVYIRLNNGAGTFSGSQSVTVGRGPVVLAIGDVDGDGDLDFAVTSSSTPSISVRLNDGAGNFTGSQSVAVGSNSYGIVLGDLDNDGDLDLAATSYFTNAVSIRLNDGAGNFSGSRSVAVGTSLWSVALADLDNDLDLDLIATNYASNTVSVRFNGGNGVFNGFQDLVTGSGPTDLALSDVDGDGDADLLIPNFNGTTVDIRLNNGTGTFGSVQAVAVGNAPGTINLGDVDADGDLDFVTTNFNAGTASVRLNGGTGPLATAVGYASPVALTAYPNPARTTTLVGAAAGSPVYVYDALGRRVFTALASAAGTASLVLPISLPAGTYVVRNGVQAVRLTVE